MKTNIVEKIDEFYQKHGEYFKHNLSNVLILGLIYSKGIITDDEIEDLVENDKNIIDYFMKNGKIPTKFKQD